MDPSVRSIPILSVPRTVGTEYPIVLLNSIGVGHVVKVDYSTIVGDR